MASLYKTNIVELKGIGNKTALLFNKVGIYTIGDLLNYYPRDYEDWSVISYINSIKLNEINTIKAIIKSNPKKIGNYSNKIMYKIVVEDSTGNMDIIFFNNPYITNIFHQGMTIIFRGVVTLYGKSYTMLSPKYQSSNSFTMISPIYRQTSGLNSKLINKEIKQAIKMLPDKIRDPLPKDILQNFNLCSLYYAITNIHIPENKDALEKSKRRLIFEELLTLQLGLRQIKQKSLSLSKHKITKDYSKEFEDLLPYPLTNAQKNAITDSLTNMISGKRMNRLLQGDVGSGKTAVAASLIYTVIKNGYQAAILAPTELLAQQHYEKFINLFSKCGINICLLTGSTSLNCRHEIYQNIHDGSINLAIGTHSLLNDNLEFSNLGLVVTDEQHRFGVEQRTKLAAKGDNPHMLFMSATPIPRTLALMIYGELDISILDELPPGRQHIDTYCINSNKRYRAFEFIRKLISEGKQAYIICPLIDESDSDLKSISEYKKILLNYFDKTDFAILHGKMKPSDKEKIMSDFANNKVKILLSTTVVEVGMDVPNAVIMLIENAERYGLSQIHQLRGRIGRGLNKSYCILISDVTNKETQERINILCKTNDGFIIANQDLQSRGPGDFFGNMQHGLPKLKIADMNRDTNLLSEVTQAAESIMSKDPELLSPENTMLSAEILRLFGSVDISF
jgi:ATP-dependent DNA helicase RecG